MAPASRSRSSSSPSRRGSALHSAYLWQAPGYEALPIQPKETLDPQSPDAGPLSDTLRANLDAPGVGSVLGLLPDPFVRGIDYQKYFSEAGSRTRFGDRLGPGFPAYFVVALGLKSPLSILWLTAIGAWVVLSSRRLGAGGRSQDRQRDRTRAVLASTIPAIAVPLVYLSWCTTMQIGVRYALPVVPLLALYAGCGVAWLLALGSASGGHDRSTLDWRFALGRGVVCASAAALAGFLVSRWPHYAFSFNALAAERPYLWFGDSNICWRCGVEPDAARVEVQRRWPDSHEVFAESGPSLRARVRARRSLQSTRSTRRIPGPSLAA